MLKRAVIASVLFSASLSAATLPDWVKSREDSVYADLGVYWGAQGHCPTLADGRLALIFLLRGHGYSLEEYNAKEINRSKIRAYSQDVENYVAYGRGIRGRCLAIEKAYPHLF